MYKLRLKFFCVTVAVMFMIKSYSQNPTDITLDFSTKTFVNPHALDNLKQGNWYRLIIKHINLNLYKITFDKTDSILKPNISTPDFTPFNLDNLTKLVGSLGSPTTLASMLRDSLSLKQYFANTTTKSSEDLLKAREYNLLLEQLEQIKERMDQEKLNLQKETIKLSDEKKAIDELYLKFYQYQLLSKTETDQTSDYIALMQTSFNFAEVLKEIGDIRQDLNTLQKEAAAKADEYNNFSDNKKKEIEEAPSLKENDKKIKNSYSTTLSIVDKLSDNINADKVNQFLSAIVLQDNNKDFTYTSTPQQLNGDIGILHLTVEPRGDISLQKYITEIHFPKPQLFYIGVGASLYYSGLYDEAYSAKTNENGTDTTYSLVNEDPKKNEFGMAILLRYGWKFDDKSTIGAHFTFGPAISISNKIKPRIVIGGGFSIGNENMLVIDAGLIGGYAERLSKAFILNQSYQDKPTQPTVSVLKTSWFISLGYLYRF